MVLMECCICGDTACSKVKRKTRDGEVDLYYCKEHLRGKECDESFFDIDD